MKRKSNVVKTICYILMFLLVIGVFFTIFALTDGFKSPIKSFYVTQDGTTLTDKDTIILYANEDCSLKYNVLGVDKKDTTYNVKVVGNFNEDLTYYVDGQPYGFSGLEDFSKYFNLQKEMNTFSLNIGENFNIINILEDIYQGKEIVFDELVDLSSTSCFMLVISDSNNKNSLSIPLLIGISVENIELDKSEIAF